MLKAFRTNPAGSGTFIGQWSPADATPIGRLSERDEWVVKETPDRIEQARRSFNTPSKRNPRCLNRAAFKAEAEFARG
jgi:hypothetical protein